MKACERCGAFGRRLKTFFVDTNDVPGYDADRPGQLNSYTLVCSRCGPPTYKVDRRDYKKARFVYVELQDERLRLLLSCGHVCVHEASTHTIETMMQAERYGRTFWYCQGCANQRWEKEKNAGL